MPQFSRISFVLIASGISISLISSVQAQQGTRPGQRQLTPTGGAKTSSSAPAKKEEMPRAGAAGPKGAAVGGGAQKGGAPAAAAALTPEEIARAKALDVVLSKWELESSKIKSLHGTHTKSSLNPTFNVETVSSGPFFFETPDRGRIDFLAVNIKGKSSTKKNKKSGELYELASGQSERWICNGTQIIEIMEDEKTYTAIEIPEEKRGANIIHTPLPFLFGMKAEEAKARFDLKWQSENADSVVLYARPKMAQDQQNYRVAEITLSKKNHFVPEKVRLLDQEQEIEYRFEKTVINDGDFKGKMSTLLGMKGDPFNPSLKGYTVVVPPEDPIAAREEKQIQQINGQKKEFKTTKAPDEGGAAQPRQQQAQPKSKVAPRTPAVTPTRK